MDDQIKSDSNKVSVTMEISGMYDEVLSKLKYQEENTSIAPLIRDVEILLETLERMEEGTRSAIADRLSEEMTVEYDAEEVVDLLQVLKRYDLVVLEGNTWKPAPKKGE
ncbi:hypothetical protein ACOZ4B_02010 (plasmid) [Haloferax prahovense]|jgi:hypothetical protein|uniref:hypothetical protein n=1 Tax=Haloferax prahovense TaxID=381852 RepID=UPI003C7298E0